MKIAANAKRYIRLPAYVVLLLICASGSLSCTSKLASEVRYQYTIGTSYSDVPISGKSILLDFSYSQKNGPPLIISLYGYRSPTRPLQSDERLIIVAEELDLVSYLFFSSNSLIAVEVVGS